jgi:beta-barrel assembly-enhancing protease
LNVIPATLHALTLGAAGAPCQLRFVGSTLHVTGSAPQYVAAAGITVSTGGFHDDLLILSWTAAGTQYSAVIADAAHQATLVKDAPVELAPLLKQGKRHLNYHRQKWNVVLGTLGTLAALGVLAWWQSAAIVHWLAERVPVAREVRLGETMLDQLRKEGDLRDSGPAVDAVSQIGARLTRGSRYKYQWFLKDDATVNAFALPGGIVVVNSALVDKADSAEELAGVIAHEIQHVEKRHSLQQMIHSAGWAAVLMVAMGDVSAIAGIFVHQAGTLRHSRALESEADSEGMRSLVKAGISPNGMAHFFEKMQEEESADGGLASDLLSSHPAPADRLEAMHELASKLTCKCQPLELNWPAVQQDVQQEDAAKSERKP